MVADKINQENLPESRTVDGCDLDTIHIQIGEQGEISAWGLDQNSEAAILELTGNKKLAEYQKKMSYTFCG